MDEATVELKAPVEIYEWAEIIAARRASSAESVLLEGLAALLGPLSDFDLEPEELKHFDDDQLRKVVNQRLTWLQNMRLRELLRLGQSGQITDDESQELETLLELVDHQILLRSEALLLLRRRGNDIRELLKLGA